MKLPISTKSSISTSRFEGREVRFTDVTAAGCFDGYGSVFGGPVDSYGDIILPGAFRATIAEHQAKGTMPIMLWSHNGDQPIGRWIEMKEDDYGLFLRGKINIQTERGREALEHLKHGDIAGLSIGGNVTGVDTPTPKGVRRAIRAFDLWEISVVSFPANQRARISGVKSLQTKSELIDLLREGGLSKAAAARVAAGGWSALGTDETGDLGDLAQAIMARTEELKSWK